MANIQRKLACDACRRSKVRCDGVEGEKMCTRCTKKESECTWNTPRCKRGRKTIPPKMSGDYEMGLFCLTPKNLIQLNENHRGSISKDEEDSFWNQPGMGVITPSSMSSSSPITVSSSAINQLTNRPSFQSVQKRSNQRDSISLDSLPGFGSPHTFRTPQTFIQPHVQISPSKSTPTPLNLHPLSFSFPSSPSLSTSTSNSNSVSHSPSPYPLSPPQEPNVPVVRSTWPPSNDQEFEYSFPSRNLTSPNRKFKSEQELTKNVIISSEEDVKRRCSVRALVNDEDEEVSIKTSWTMQDK